MTQESIVEEILSECKRQKILYGEQNHTPVKWIAILAEEVGSAAKQANKFDDADKELNLRKYETETIQVAAVALQMLLCLERGKWNEKLSPSGS